MAVGATNTTVTLSTYAAALLAGAPYLLAGAVAFVLGALNGFALNRTWTFAHAGPLGPAGARYAAVQLLGLASDLALLRIGVRGFGLAHLPAQVAAVAPVTLLTFVLSRTWTFRPAPSPAPHPVDPARPAPRGRRRPDHRRFTLRRRRPHGGFARG
jgi:putative flippase GtrA